MAASVPAALPTVTGLLLARAASPEPGLRFEDRRWSWQEHVGECARYAAALRARRSADQHGAGRPFHVGVLADNVPEFSFLLGGCAFAGAVLVALNPVRRGAALARDVARTDCQYVLADPRYAPLLAEADVPVLPLDGLALPADAPPEVAPLEVAPATPDDLLMLIFTSGTSGEPKAVRCPHGKIAVPERADDADSPLRIAYGNEGAPADLARFAERFGCTVIDGLGSPEGGVGI